jgi:hypothetical protein
VFKRSIVAPIIVALAGVSLGAWALVTPTSGAAQSLGPLTITKIAADGDHFLPGAHAYYQIEICNPNGGSVSVDYIIDTLPSGFSYVSQSTSGFADFDPDISGQTLSWFLDGQSLAGETCATTNFTASISEVEPLGMYCNEASVESDAGTSSTGPTAAMQVLNEGDTQQTPTCPGGKVRTATPTVTETEPPTATEVPATETPVPPPPTATSPSGGSEGVISAPNTGSGPSAGGPSTLLLAIAAAMVVGGVGATAVSLRRR